MNSDEIKRVEVFDPKSIVPIQSKKSIKYDDLDKLKDADFLIIVSPTFEEISHHAVRGRYEYFSNEPRNQINLWIRAIRSFAERKIVLFLDTGLQGFSMGFQGSKFSDTDLLKELLSKHKINWKATEDETVLTSEQSYFNNYVKKFGISKTRYFSKDVEVLITSEENENLHGFSFDNFYVLPFQNLHRPLQDKDICDMVSSISNHRRRISDELPSWLTETKFDEEIELESEIKEISNRLDIKKSRLAEFEAYKRILVGGGNSLTAAVAFVLKHFFEFKVNDNDEFIEDISLRNDCDVEIALIEVKGTRNGISSDYVMQALRHRQKHYPSDLDFPTFLIVNTFNTIATLDEPHAISDYCKELASRNRITILTTRQLFDLMKKTESSLPSLRRSKFMELSLTPK